MRSRLPKSSSKTSSKKTSGGKRIRLAEIPDQPLVTDEHVDGRYGEIVRIWDASGQTPVSGGSYYIFLDQSKIGITLLHPFSLTKFTMDTLAFQIGKELNDWNPGPGKIADLLKRKIQAERELKREVPNYLLLLIQHFEKLAQESI
jgi:hypothetical protein